MLLPIGYALRRKGRKGKQMTNQMVFDWEALEGLSRSESRTEPMTVPANPSVQIEPPPAAVAQTAGAPEQAQPPVIDVVWTAVSDDSPGHREGDHPGVDYRITPADRLGQGSLREKFRDNVAAIRLLRQLTAEQRMATPEEQAVLVRYVGWGGMPQAFTPQKELGYLGNREWEEPRRKLQELLTEAEYKAARSSTINAHYTSEVVIRGIYDGLNHLGFDGGRVLEPACGIGHFFGLMPAEVKERSQLTGVELDLVTGSICRHLYQRTDIRIQGFETAVFPANHFDLVVGNVPFGNYPVHDPRYNRYRFMIHDYFLARSVDLVQPGGLVILITSRYTMDKKGSSLRRHLASRSDLLGAIRLPNTAFRMNANTQVTSDILILRKRTPGEPASGESWLNLGQLNAPDGTAIPVNEYFACHPEMVCGRMTLRRGQYGDPEPTCETDGRDLEHAIKAAFHSVPPDGYRKAQSQQPGVAKRHDLLPAPGWVRPFAYAVVDGRLLRRDGENLVSVDVPQTTAARIRGMIAIRDAARKVLQVQLEGTDFEVAMAQGNLNYLYDRFVGQHGYLNARANRRAFAGDPDLPLILSLEQWNEENGVATKADLFSKRTVARHQAIDRVDTAKEALLVSLNETGRVDWTRMQQLTGQPQAELRRELAGLVYLDPATHRWETAEQYLSGNVRVKLREAQEAAERDTRFRENVEALQAVQPTDLKPSEIDVRLGSPWIPEDDYSAFVGHLFGETDAARVRYIPAAAVWTVTANNWSIKDRVANTEVWGTRRAPALELIEKSLRQQVPTIYDQGTDEKRTVNQAETLAAREKAEKLQSEFRRWIWSDQDRAERLCRLYNDTFNAIRLPVYSGEHLTLPGIARVVRGKALELRPHQKDAIWRIIQSGNTLLAHVVGAGKTWVMVAAAMELRRLGLARKPLFAVPNHLLEQWGREFLQLYPTANVLIASQEDFEKGRRRLLFARMASGDYDAVICAHSSFTKLRLSDQFVEGIFQEQISEILDAISESREHGDRDETKELEKARKRLEAKMQARLAQHKKDDLLTFEELGIDWLFVDEAHLFKNLWFATRMPRIAGLPNSDAERSWDLFLKTQYLARIHGRRRGVVFATGTPVTNTIAEVYTMQRFLAMDVLQDHGIDQFDAWAANFGQSVTALEVAPDGSGFRINTRFAKFVNVPELMQLFRLFADVRTADMLNLPAPPVVGGKPVTVSAPAAPALKEYVASLVERAEAVRNGHVDPSVDNMLRITTDGRKAALDMRLVNPAQPDDPNSKINLMVEKAVAVWRESLEWRGAQLIFCDLGTPTERTFNVYDEVRRKLIAAGVPADEIAFIHEADTDAAKDRLFKAVRSGRIRFLLGSTLKMGAGTNVQDRLVGLHHLDAPWRPDEIEQREGRILRQGNLLYDEGMIEGVRIYRYVTSGSFDAYMWQVLEVKARFIAQIVKGDAAVRTVEDLEGAALTYAEVKALASGNPLVMRKILVDTEVRKLSTLRAQHEQTQREMQYEVARLPRRMETARANLQAYLEDTARRQNAEGDRFAIDICGRSYTERREAGAALQAAWPQVISEANRELRAFGRFAGFTLGVLRIFGDPHLCLKGAREYYTDIRDRTDLGVIRALEHLLVEMESRIDPEQRDIADMERRLADLQQQLGIPFEHQDRLEALLKEQAELTAALDLTKSDRQAAAQGDETDQAA